MLALWHSYVRSACIVDDCHWLCRDSALSAAHGKQRAGRGLSPDSRKERDLELSPEQEKLLARQVTVHCVRHCVMAVVCAQRLNYSRLSLTVQGHCIQSHSWQEKGRHRVESRLPQKAPRTLNPKPTDICLVSLTDLVNNAP